MRSLLLSVACALLLALPAAGADLTVSVPPTEADAGDRVEREATLSNALSLLLVRVTFDVTAIEDVEPALDARLVAWGIGAPSAGERDEIERQLLAEASYYIVSLRYLIEVGGAAFPADRAETAYASDTLVRLDSLERALGDRLAMHLEVADLLGEVEAIRALTEGYAEPPDDFGVFTRHAALLQRLLERARTGTPT